MSDLRVMPAEMMMGRELPSDLNSSSAGLSARPPRASLVNLATNEEYQFLFNPETLDEKIEAKYSSQKILGLSHERLSYQNTTNNEIPLELYLSQLAQDVIANQGDSSPPISQQKAWLQSLVYPVESESGIVGPPQVLFVWPRIARMICRVKSVEFSHTVFSNRTLASVRITAKVTLVEDVESRRLMADVQLDGDVVASEDL